MSVYQRILYLLAALAVLAPPAGCRQEGEDRRGMTADEQFAAFEAELMQADRDFAAAVAAAAPADRAAVWAAFFAADGLQIVPAEVISGTEAITSLMAPAFADESFSLSWDPDRAEAAADGSLGFTSGRYTSRRRGDDGEEVLGQGRYVTIWNRRPDGRWQVALDTGVPDPSPPDP